MDREDWPFGLAKSLKEAKQLRREVLAELANEPARKGEAERIANCGRDRRCRQKACPICSYWQEMAQRRTLQSAQSIYVIGKNGAHLAIDALKILPNRRPADPAKVRLIAASMAVIGQLYPIIVREVKKKFYVTAGLHRVEAAKSLGWQHIWCTYTMGGADDVEVRMILISENLHRADLRVLDRAEYIDEWRRLVRQRAKEGQIASPVMSGGMPSGGTQPSEAGIKKTARALGLTPREVRRARAIATMSPDAKGEARQLRLDNSQHVLLAVAKLPGGVQVNALRDVAEERAAKTKAHIPLATQAALAEAAKLQSAIAKDEERVLKLTATVSANKKLLAGVTAVAQTVPAQDDSTGEAETTSIVSPPTVPSDGPAASSQPTGTSTPRAPGKEQSTEPPQGSDADAHLEPIELCADDQMLLNDLLTLWRKAPVQVQQLFVSSALTDARGR